MLCAIYVRLSKEDEEKQQHESESIQNQKSLLTHYALGHGWDIYSIYCDEDYSGADSLRPDFNRMIEAAKQKKFQIVLCKTQSRFTRDMELVEKYIHGLFPILGVRFIALADNADTEVKGNKKARQINGLINEWYLEDLSENVRMVLDLKRREGKYIGGFPVYGYKKDPDDKNKIVVDPEAAAVVRRIFQWALEGHGKQNIARMLNEEEILSPAKYKEARGWGHARPGGNDMGIWNKTTVWRMLRNEMYAGVMVQGRKKKISYKSQKLVDVPEEHWFRVEGTHEAIIDRETFQAVQRSLQLRSKTDGHGEAHPLSGIVKCMDCGSTMAKTTNCPSGQTRRSYLRCSTYAAGGERRLCTRHSIRLDELIALVSERIRQYIQDYYNLEEIEIEPGQAARREELKKERRALAASIEKRSQALKSLYLDKSSGMIGSEQFRELNEELLKEKTDLERRFARVEDKMAAQIKPVRQEELMKRAQELLKLKSVPRELIVGLIDKIEIGEKDRTSGRQEIRITWKF